MQNGQPFGNTVPKLFLPGCLRLERNILAFNLRREAVQIARHIIGLKGFNPGAEGCCVRHAFLLGNHGFLLLGDLLDAM
jgi:hypothetical protein